MLKRSIEHTEALFIIMLIEKGSRVKGKKPIRL